MNELYMWLPTGCEEVARITSEGIIANVSPALERVIGRSTSELVGSHCHSLVHPDDLPSATDYLHKLSNGQQVPPLTLSLLQRSGGYRIVEIIGKPDTTNGNGCHVWTATPEPNKNMGPTKRSKALTQEKLRNRYLLDLIRAASAQAASSLTSIHFMTDILSTQSIDPLVQASVIRIEREVQYLSNLSERVRTMAELDADHIAFSFRPISLNRLAQYLETRVMHLAEERNISLVMTLSEDLPAVRADEMMLYQAIQEVIDNAIKSVPESGTVTIRTFERGAYGIVEVQDTGRGIPPDLIARLFEPFDDSGQALFSKGKLGFGLPIAKKIIDKHHGTIEVVGSPEKGTTVTIAIPVED